MQDKRMFSYISDVIENMPNGWLSITTHRLDIYNEELAKVQFLEGFEALYENDNAATSALNELPTAYDYIRLGHPLSCVLEWLIARLGNHEAEQVISFASTTIPIMAILRKNLFADKKTRLLYTDSLPSGFESSILKDIYGYNFEVEKIQDIEEINDFDGSTILISNQDEKYSRTALSDHIDFLVTSHKHLGSILVVNGKENEDYISDIQHVRRRETIAMTPANSLRVIKAIIDDSSFVYELSDGDKNRTAVEESIKKITGTISKPLVASSGLSVQYAILMGLIDDAMAKHSGKAIKIVVPPNCYGGTNDQSRRVAACLDNVSVVDLPVDGDNDMVQSVNVVLDRIAKEDAVPLIIAEIPTNPRVEVPNLIKLKAALSKSRTTPLGSDAVAPVFILDQTFCPNVKFLGEGEILSDVKTISFSSGSKFPSGGLCTAGYCVGNANTDELIANIDKHLRLCDNEATELQLEILAKLLPSMTQRIKDAYQNTREFVSFIQQTLPEAKINFVSEELASQGFTPSVFSLDLPTKGDTDAEREAYKRASNLKLINKMITEIPDESKYCVSYGQLKGCYWTIPATSTQGTTKEGDKDYIVRAALSPRMDVALHKKVFSDFVKGNR